MDMLGIYRNYMEIFGLWALGFPEIRIPIQTEYTTILLKGTPEKATYFFLKPPCSAFFKVS